MIFQPLWSWLGSVIAGDINISCYAPVIGWMFFLLPRLYAQFTYTMSTGKLVDLSQPRKFTQTVYTDPALSSRARARILRADAAGANTIENISFFAAAIVIGNQGDLSASLLNALSVAYLFTRLLYIAAYIFSETATMTILRVFFFFTGHTISSTLFILAAKQT